MIKCMTVDSKKDEMEKMIFEYLKENPNAEDTVEGIARWWLKYKKINNSVDDVALALENLTKKGKLCKREVKGNLPIYKINE